MLFLLLPTPFSSLLRALQLTSYCIDCIEDIQDIVKDRLSLLKAENEYRSNSEKTKSVSFPHILMELRHRKAQQPQFNLWMYEQIKLVFVLKSK